MSRVNLSRKIGDSIRITTPGGREALITIKSFERGVLQLCVEAETDVSVSRVDSPPTEEISEFDKLDDFDKSALGSYFKFNP